LHEVVLMQQIYDLSPKAAASAAADYGTASSAERKQWNADFQD